MLRPATRDGTPDRVQARGHRVADQVEEHPPPEADDRAGSGAAGRRPPVAKELDHGVPELVAEFARIHTQQCAVHSLGGGPWRRAAILRHAPAPVTG